MSKMMDLLDKVSSKKHPVLHRTEINEEIAKTYFGSNAKSPAGRKAGWRNALPWGLAAIAIVLAVAILFSRSSIDVKVRLLGEIPSLGGAGSADGSGYASEKGIYLLKGGQPNREIVKDVYFAGDAKKFSAAKPKELELLNAGSSGWANYTIELKGPVDFNKLDIKYTARGLRGDEYLLLIIGDANKRVYRLEKDLSSELSRDWQTYTVNFMGVKKAVDLSNIIFIRFEFGGLTAGNYSNAGLLLKDIYIAKTKRLKWL